MPLSNIRIIHQDAAVLVVNKPTLLLSVPGRADDNKDCLITRLQENGYPEARIVHRLDWETSGIILLARDPDTHRELSRQFHDRETEKAYTALCWGQPALDSGSIDLPLRYDPPTKPRHVVDHEFGKHALTFWRVLERCGDWCRVELTPITVAPISCACTCFPSATLCWVTGCMPTSKHWPPGHGYACTRACSASLTRKAANACASSALLLFKQPPNPKKPFHRRAFLFPVTNRRENDVKILS